MGNVKSTLDRLIHRFTHPGNQCKSNSLKNTWTIHEDLLANLKASARGAEIGWVPLGTKALVSTFFVFSLYLANISRLAEARWFIQSTQRTPFDHLNLVAGVMRRGCWVGEGYVSRHHRTETIRKTVLGKLPAPPPGGEAQHRQPSETHSHSSCEKGLFTFPGALDWG